MEKTPHVVIIGGGFGGLSAARGLANSPVRITLIDRRNHHLFQPLLYQVATAALTAPDIAAPLRKLLSPQQNARVLMADVLDLDVEQRRVLLEHGELEYDYLFLASGMKNNYFGHDDWEEHAPGLKTLSEALDIRARVLRAYEAAERETDPVRKQELLTFVVIGGGATGVEMAGALAEIATKTMADDFRSIDPGKDTRVVLLEGGPRLLPAFSEVSSRQALTDLTELGVDVRFGKFVKSVDEHGVLIGEDREAIPASTVMWAAGLKASSLTAKLGAPLDGAGRVKVEPNLTVPGRPEIYVIGDLLHLEQDGALLPGVAQTAIQSGAFSARHLDDQLRDYVPRDRFVYKDKGSMATIGRARAVAEIGDGRFSGLAAWLLWVVVHILFLVDFRNRLAVMWEWAYSYWSFRRSARVIVDAPTRHRPAVQRRAILAQMLTPDDDAEATPDQQ